MEKSRIKETKLNEDAKIENTQKITISLATSRLNRLYKDVTQFCVNY